LLLSSVRQPGLRLLANGAPVPGAIEAEILSNNHYAADRFRVTVALGSNPAAPWSFSTDILLDIQFTLDGMSWTSLLQGAVDTVEIDPIDNLLRLAGRDLTAALVESRTQETFANRTSSEIAELLASRHGLSTDVQPTTTPVGRYWQLEHDRIMLDQFSHATTEWDLLVTLAQHEGFDVWLSGTTLHFRPPVATPSTIVVLRPVATLNGPANITALRLERSLTLARDIEVTVKSWNSRQQNAFVQTARATGPSMGKTGPGLQRKPQRYVYVVPNLTPDDALKLAQRRLAELSQHERVVVADMPGELTLAPRMQLRVEGTATDFDQVYWIDEIERRLHVTEGFTQCVRAKNASPASQATSPSDEVISPWTVS
jgi:phage protein D